MHKLLFVDDEKAILSSLKRLFFKSDLNLFFADDGKEALQILAEHKIDMIISDMRMPEMDGHKLLLEVQRLYPDTIRFILSGHTDEIKIHQAVMDGSAKMYLLKPWDPQKLLDFIIYTFNFRDMLEARGILKYIDDARLLPSDSEVRNKLCRLLEGDENPIVLWEAIEKDPGFSAKVLQFANSSYFDIKVGSIRKAVEHLGKNVIRSLLLNTDTYFEVDKIPELASDYRLVTEQAIISNRIIKLIYKDILKKEAPDICVSAGLLHDLGLIMMKAKIAEQALSELEIVMPDSEGQGRITHEELGGYLLQHWGLTEAIVECALYHHHPLSAKVDNLELVCAVHLADYYAWESLGRTAGHLEPKAFDVLKTDEITMKNIISNTTNQ